MADEINSAGGISGDAIKAAQESIATIAKSMSSIEASAKEFAKHMRAVGALPGGATTAGGPTTGTSTPGGAGNTGRARSQGVQAAAITPTTGQGAAPAAPAGNAGPGGTNNRAGTVAPIFKGDIAEAHEAMGWRGVGATAAYQSLRFGTTAAVGFLNDFRLGANRAMEYEWNARTAAFGTGNLTRYGDNLAVSMNAINVQNPAMNQAILSQSLAMGHGALFGGGPGGEKKAALNVQGITTLGTLAGMTTEQSGTAMNSIYSAQSYYKALAGGVSTRKANGDMMSTEEIVNQYRSRYSGNLEELNRTFAQGGMGLAEMEQTFGTEGAQTIIEGLKLSAQTGKPLKQGELDELAKEAGMSGTPETQGLDSTAKTNRTDTKRQIEFNKDVTRGIDRANQTLQGIYDRMFTDRYHGATEELEYLGGIADTMNTTAPSVMKSIGGGLSAAASVLGPTLALGAKALGAKGLLGAASRVLGPLSAVAPLAEVATNITAAARGANETENLDKGDWLQRTLWRTGEGALAGAALGAPFGGIGALPGAIGGAITGLVLGGVESSVRENTDIETGSPFAKGDWFVESDQNARIHEGEMILPSRIAQSVRDELDNGRRPKNNLSSVGASVTINLTVQSASDQEAMVFARRVKTIIEDSDELYSVGSGSL